MPTVGMKDIKRRKKSIENTMKITKAMELVAFSKLKKSKQRVVQTKPFFNKIYNLMVDISKKSANIESVYLKKRPVKKACYIIIAGEKGLAGGYNENLFKFSFNQMKKYKKENIILITIGKKATDFYKKRNYEIYNSYDGISENLTIEKAKNIADDINEGFINGKFEEVYIIFTNFTSVLIQLPQVKKVLPLYFKGSESKIKSSYTIYEPSAQKVFNMVVPQYLTGVLFGAVSESFASEQGARRIAMEAANKNAKDMLQDINVAFNKVRQANITQEITEISSGANFT